MIRVLRRVLVLGVLVSLVGVGWFHARVSAEPTAPVFTPAYQVSLFASGTSAYSHPDSVEVDANLHYIYVGYQNVTAKDGTDNKSSTIVQYNRDGSVHRTVAIPGHNDGLRVDPSTHRVWASSNEDGNPVLTTIDPFTGRTTGYTFPTTLHGGGFDDLAFAAGRVYIVASNPTLDDTGVNVFPALDQMQLTFDNSVSTQPVVMGNASALDLTTSATTTLNITDPDSLTVDPSGDVVLVDQAGAQLLFLRNPGTVQQSLARLPLGTQVDDTVWATSSGGSLLIVDGKANAVWQVKGPFTPGTVYTEAASDSGVGGFVGTIDLASGNITPVGIGFGSPTGMAFAPPS